jgi:nucleotide-binding universal stress UspA family protein
MKKILLAFDGTHFSEGALRFVKKLNEHKQVLVTGAFLPQEDYANLWSYSGGGTSGSTYIPLLEDADTEAVKKNVKRFESFCHTNQIRFRIHKDYLSFTLPELKIESRYADLLILSSEVFYEHAGTNEPNEYLKQALHDVECPVIIVPEKYEFPESNILSYDGSESSVTAIKQFACLFPELASHPSVLVYGKEKNEEEFPHEQNIKELLSIHYPQLVWLKLEADYKKYFATWISEKKATILISGSFGRSGFSMLFKKSFITDVISEHRVPVFIAHT